MSELNVSVTIEVGATLEAAWTFVATDYFDNHHRWDPAIVGMERLTDGAVGVGTAGVETRKFLGRQKAGFVVTEFDPTSRFAFRNTSGPFHLERSYAFSASRAGTTIAFGFRMRPKPVAAPLFFVARRQIETQVAANIQRLATLL